MDFEKKFEAKVKKTIKDYALIDKKDKVFVACSGGKDSTTVLYLLKKFGYDVDAVMIDLKMGDWSDKNLNNLKDFCKKLDVRLNIIDIRENFGCSLCYLRSGIQETERIGNCTICGVVRRWLLNKKARELGATKIATGHNLDDEAENVMMNLLKGNPELFVNFGPKTGMILDQKFVQRIKPLYFCLNREVRKFSEKKQFNVVYEPCPCSIGSFRRQVRTQMTELEKKTKKDLKINIVKNLLKMLPDIQKAYKSSSKITYCKICGEPGRNDICRRCSLIDVINKKK